MENQTLDSMTDTDDWLPPPPPPEDITDPSGLPLPPAPVIPFLEMPDFDKRFTQPPTVEEQTTITVTDKMTTTYSTTTVTDNTTVIAMTDSTTTASTAQLQ